MSWFIELVVSLVEAAQRLSSGTPQEQERERVRLKRAADFLNMSNRVIPFDLYFARTEAN